MVRNFGGQPRSARIFHRPSLLTVSKSLVRSMAENGEELWRATKTRQDFPDPPCLLYQSPRSGRWQRMVRNFGGQPRRARIFHRPSLLTVSKSLVRSMAENGEELWRATKTRQDFPDPPCLLYQSPRSGRWQRMVRNFGGQPRRARIFHRPSLLTVSKSLVRSMAENGEELWRVAKTRQDFPQTLPAYCIKGLGQVDGREW